MKQFFLLAAAASLLLAAGCSLPDVPGIADGSTGDGNPGDAKADGRASHLDAGKEETDAAKDDGRAKEGGGNATEAGCSDAETFCDDGGTCVNEETDPKNCGGCGNDCTLAPHVDPNTTTCNGGQCVYACAPGFADDCGGDAGAGCPTSLSTPANCGSCRHACTGATSLCSASTTDGGAATCTSSCAGGTSLCNGSCVNSQTDPSACGSSCASCPYVCIGGVCSGSCTPATSGCSGSQPQTCSASGTWVDNGAACGACYVCSSGGCSPSSGGGCNDGNACTQTDTCTNGVCIGSNPVVCTASDACHVAGACNTSTGVCSVQPLAPDANCQSGQTCIQWYPDCDQDGYGNPSGPAVNSCSSPTGAPACPAGFTGVYVASNTDCCDRDMNAHPTQTAYFTTPDACGSTTQTAAPYDYNCNGTDEQQSDGPTDCIPNPFTCTLVGTTCEGPTLPADCKGNSENYNVAACGVTSSFTVEGCTNAGPGCTTFGTGGAAGTQACH